MTSWKQLAAAIERMQQANITKTACVGFDGYIDALYKVVRSRESRTVYTPYETIADFASHLLQAASRSADMELVEISRRMGGNAPLMAEALGCLGLSVHCIGAMGYPELDDVFLPNNNHFTPHSVASSAKTTAFEFNDGKLMFGHVTSLHDMDWKSICRTMGLSAILELYRSCDLWAIVNWSFLISSNEIINGFLQDVVEACSGEENAKKILFFDLADPSGRSPENLLRLFSLLSRLAAHCRVVLGLNLNESLRVADALGIDTQQEPEQLAAALRKQLRIGMVAIHALDWAAGATADEAVREQSLLVTHPAISTGGGDNFNAGLCTALLNDLPLADALAFANMVSSYYVSNGCSAALKPLSEYALHAGIDAL